MAHQNSVDPDGGTALDFSRIETMDLDSEMRWLAARSFGKIAGLSNAGMSQLLADLADPESYQVALVPSASTVLPTDSNSVPPTITRKLLFLPLTWKDISPFVRDGYTSTASAGSVQTVQFGEILVDLYRMTVARGGEDVLLTALEFKVLRFLIINRDRVVSRDELLNKVWGYYNYPCTRTVDNHILRLRQKLEVDPSRPIHFRTIHRVGYRFVG